MPKITTSFSSNITLNGKQIDSVDDLPAELQKFVKDADNNGVPDFVEATMKQAHQEKTSVPKTDIPVEVVPATSTAVPESQKKESAYSVQSTPISTSNSEQLRKKIIIMVIIVVAIVAALSILN